MWISVFDKLPDSENLIKYRVKLNVGSISVKTLETEVLGKMYPSGFRFMTGDWQTVTHWWKNDSDSI